MSGIGAQRGFIYQSIIAMIECLERNDWDAIKLEPPTEYDKVDIQLSKQGQISTAIQVKSSQYAFSKPDVERWLKELKSDACDANNIVLCLVGDSYSSDCEDYIKQHRCEIKKAPFNNLEALCFGKLMQYVNRVGIGQKVCVSDLDLIDASLFSKIHRNSIDGRPLGRPAFEEAFYRALPVYSKSESDGEKGVVIRYYDYVAEKFCEKPEEREASLFGVEPINSSYIDPYYKEDGARKLLIEGVERWCSQRMYGVMLLHGEPGHGKTSFCRKCVYEFIFGNHFRDQKNVFAFTINPAKSDVLAESRLKIEKAFTWGLGNPLIPVSLCHSSVVFLDGFDEFIDEARKKGSVDSIIDFMDMCFEFSKEHKMKIIITSRSMCIREDIPDVQMRYTVYKFEPLSLKQQVAWISERKEYGGYIDTFLTINSSEGMKTITGIPILFRMIVTMRFDREIDNRALLYEELFYLTLKRQKHSERSIKEIYKKFEKLAYNIFADNEDTTEIDDADAGAAWTYSYYVKAEGKQRLGFLHRSFYENFLSSYFASKLSCLQSDQEKQKFIELLSVRKLTTEYINSLVSVFNMRQKEYNGGVNDLVNNFQSFLDYLSANDMNVVKTVLKSTNMSFMRFIDWTECVFFNVNAINYVLQQFLLTKENRKNMCHPIHFDIDLMGRLFGFLNMKGGFLRGDYSSLNVEGAHLEDSTISIVNLLNTNMPATHLQSSNLVFLTIGNSFMRGSFWQGASSVRCTVRNSDLSYSVFAGAKLLKVYLEDVRLVHSDFSGAKIEKSVFRKTDFSYSDFSAVFFKETRFETDCVFDYAIIPKQHRGILEEQGLDLKKVIWID